MSGESGDAVTFSFFENSADARHQLHHSVKSLRSKRTTTYLPAISKLSLPLCHSILRRYSPSMVKLRTRLIDLHPRYGALQTSPTDAGNPNLDYWSFRNRKELVARAIGPHATSPSTKNAPDAAHLTMALSHHPQLQRLNQSSLGTVRVHLPGHHKTELASLNEPVR